MTRRRSHLRRPDESPTFAATMAQLHAVVSYGDVSWQTVRSGQEQHAAVELVSRGVLDVVSRHRQAWLTLGPKG